MATKLESIKKEVYLFRLLKEIGSNTIEGDDNFPKRYRLVPKDIAYIDIGKGNIVPREIRYVRGESTIFPDEQRKDAKGTEIYFENGWLTVRNIEPMLLKFLQCHSANMSNSLRDKSVEPKFLEYTPDNKLKEFNDQKEIITNVRAIIYDLFRNDFESLQAYAIAIGEDPKLPAQALLHNMLIRAEGNPEVVLAEMGSPALRYRFFLMTALERGIIKEDKNVMLWGDGAELGFAANLNDNVFDSFTEWCMNEAAGKKIYATIKLRLENPLLK